MDIPPTWLAAFPGTRFFPVHQLLVWRPRGVLNLIQAEAIARWMEAVEPRLGTFNRFVDLSELSEVHLRVRDVADLAARRRGSYSGKPVATVVLADTALTFGVASMYARLMAGTPVHVRVVMRVSSACRILGVTPAVLERSPEPFSKEIRVTASGDVNTERS